MVPLALESKNSQSKIHGDLVAVRRPRCDARDGLEILAEEGAAAAHEGGVEHFGHFAQLVQEARTVGGDIGFEGSDFVGVQGRYREQKNIQEGLEVQGGGSHSLEHIDLVQAVSSEAGSLQVRPLLVAIKHSDRVLRKVSREVDLITLDKIDQVCVNVDLDIHELVRQSTGVDLPLEIQVEDPVLYCLLALCSFYGLVYDFLDEGGDVLGEHKGWCLGG